MIPTVLRDNSEWSFYETGPEVEKARRRFDGFLLPLVRRLRPGTVLDVGCGAGRFVLWLRDQGSDAWGVDPELRQDIQKLYPCLVPGDGMSLEFADGRFEFVYALEVIEHIGTWPNERSMMNASPDCRERREQFVGELCRVSGRYVLITTPNRLFPADEHAPDRTGRPGFRWHSPFEEATLSARDLEQLFRRRGFRVAEFVSPQGYFQLERVERKLGRWTAGIARHLLGFSAHSWIARSPLNPHLFMLFERADH